MRHSYIDMIQPTTRFGEMQAERSLIHDLEALGQAPYFNQEQLDKMNNQGQGACEENVTPACLRALYRIPDPSTLKIDNDTCGFMAFANFLDQIPRYSDLQTFHQEYAPFASGQTFSWESVAGADNNQNSPDDSVEANLDVQYLQATGFPVQIHSYNTAGRGPLVTDLDQPDPNKSTNEPYLDFLNYILGRPDHELPHTLTFSYGENEQSVPQQYRKTVCSMFGQLGARGVSVIFSSGDTGVTSACQTNDGTKRTRFLPVFPAACPWVTSTGGTTGTSPERAVDFSSGGFSDTWPRPAYQEQAVANYLGSIGNLWQGLYNPQGRGFPDVAAQGYRFHVIDKGQDKLISGTSAASPAFAGIISLLNSQRILNGKKPLGFLNPWIYSEGYKGLNDITTGGSLGCDGTNYYTQGPTPIVPGAGWNATQGWDPVTGWGTPDYPRLLQLAMNAEGSQSTDTMPAAPSKRAFVA